MKTSWGDRLTVEVLPQLVQVSLKVLELHLRDLEQVLGLGERVDAGLSAGILDAHIAHSNVKVNHPETLDPSPTSTPGKIEIVASALLIIRPNIPNKIRQEPGNGHLLERSHANQSLHSFSPSALLRSH